MTLRDLFWRLDAIQPMNVVVVARLEGPFQTGSIPRHVPFTLSRREDDDHWTAVAEDELMTGFDGDDLLRLRVLEGAGGSDLLLTYHHAAGDALSGVYFLEDLLAGKPMEVPRERRDRQARPAPAWRSSIMPLRLSESETAALAERCRANQTTVHGALCAALTETLRQVWGSDSVLCASPVSFRAAGDRGFGLCVTDVTVSAETGNFWESARTLSAGIKAQRDIDQLRKKDAARQARFDHVHPGSFSRSQVGVSNLGRLDSGPPVRCLHFAATPPLPEVLACAATSRGALAVNLVVPQSCIALDERRALHNGLITRLRVAALGQARQRLLERVLGREASPIVPLSHGQRAMWFMWQVAPKSPAYNQPFAARICHGVDADRLRACFAAVMDRHETLRTVFPAENGNVVQQVLRQPTLPWTHFTEWDEATVREFYIQPFRLGNELPWRVGLFTRNPQEHLLVLSLHHIISDMWSLIVMVSEVLEAYAGRPLEPAGPPYRAYVEWQSSMLASEAGEAALRYWTSQLAGNLPPLDLPTDRPRPAVQRLAGADLIFVWNAQRTQALQRLAREDGVTLYTLLLALYQILLHRYSGQSRFFVGSPLAGRSNPEFARTVGDFINPVALLADFNSTRTFREHLTRVRDTVLAGLTHGEYPFPLLIQKLGVPREANRSPVFQTIFIFQNQVNYLEDRLDRSRLLPLEPWRIPVEGAQFDIALEFQERGSELEGTWKYDTDLFDRVTVIRFHESLETLLDAVLEDNDIEVARAPLMNAAARNKLIREWNRTAVDYAEASFLELFSAQVRRVPGNTAVSCRGRVLSYAELDRLSSERAAAFQPGRRIGVSLERTEMLLVELLAIWKAGAVYVPVEASDPPFRRELIAADALLDSDERCEGAYIIYTSGSTGKPKGVLVDHTAVANFLCSMRDQLGIVEKDRIAALTTISFDISVLELFLPLIAGASVEMLDRGAALDGDFGESNIIQATPATWQILLDSGWRPRRGMTILCGGETLTRDLANRLLGEGVGLWNMYGPTETTVWSTMACVERGDGPVPIGRPIANTRLYILDGRGEAVPEGVAGHLFIGGQGLASGYWQRPELTAQRFVPDPFCPGQKIYRTGDLARYLPGGKVEHLGREDNQIKLRGFRIEPGEIESALRAYPGIGNAVVDIREVVGLGRRLCAWYTAAGNLAPADVRAHLRATLPEHMVPAEFQHVPAIPLNSAGKVDRRALNIVKARDLGPAPAAHGLAAEIAAIWTELSGRDRVGLDDNFFDIGGHSLLLGRMQARLRTQLQIDLPITEILRCPTVRSLAERAQRLPLPALAGVNARAQHQRAALERQRRGREQTA